MPGATQSETIVITIDRGVVKAARSRHFTVRLSAEPRSAPNALRVSHDWCFTVVAPVTVVLVGKQLGV